MSAPSASSPSSSQSADVVLLGVSLAPAIDLPNVARALVGRDSLDGAFRPNVHRDIGVYAVEYVGVRARLAVSSLALRSLADLLGGSVQSFHSGLDRGSGCHVQIPFRDPYDASCVPLRKAVRKRPAPCVHYPIRVPVWHGHCRIGWCLQDGIAQIGEPNMNEKELLIHWLNDAYGMENALVQILEHQTKDAKDYPQVQMKLQQHLDQTHRH